MAVYCEDLIVVAAIKEMMSGFVKHRLIGHDGSSGSLGPPPLRDNLVEPLDEDLTTFWLGVNEATKLASGLLSKYCCRSGFNSSCSLLVKCAVGSHRCFSPLVVGK
jgi:hypothetical protein